MWVMCYVPEMMHYNIVEVLSTVIIHIDICLYVHLSVMSHRAPATKALGGKHYGTINLSAMSKEHTSTEFLSAEGNRIGAG